MIKVLIADDHIMLRLGLRSSINREPDMKVVGEAEDGPETLDAYQRLRPDVVIIDLRMPTEGGIETIRKLIKVDRAAKIIVYSNYASGDEIFQSLNSGANGFIIKDMPPNTLFEGIRAVKRGEEYLPREVSLRLGNLELSELTDREIEVLNQAAKGMSNKEVANSLNLVEGTVKVHMANIRTKLKVADRTQAIIAAVRLGLVEIE